MVIKSENTYGKRIDSLDGLRGIAILSVIFFHYYNLSPNNSPEDFSYGLNYSKFIIFEYGYLGVMLFFCISGFVITQTLHNSISPFHFAIRRFARLWPAMLICSLLTFGISFFTPYSYVSSVKNFLPSLTFLDPKIFNFIFKDVSFAWMDGAYWSLFAEVRFYLITAIIYFYDKKKFYLNYLRLALIIGLIFPISIYFQINTLRSALNFLFIANNLPWFTFGIGAYYLFIGDKEKWIKLSIVSLITLVAYIFSAMMKPFMEFDGYAQLFGAIVIYFLILSSIKIELIKTFLSWGPLSKIGIASYSLYLLHTNIGEKIIVKIGNPFNLNIWLSGFYALIPLFLIILFSQLLYRNFEAPINRWIVRRLKEASQTS